MASATLSSGGTFPWQAQHFFLLLLLVCFLFSLAWMRTAILAGAIAVVRSGFVL